jgi:L-aspartate oxidase
MTDPMYDVVIVGGGIAGTLMALELSKRRAETSIAVLTASSLDVCASGMAQGGMAAPRIDLLDDVEQHVADTLAAGNGHCNVDVVRSVIGDAHNLVRILEDAGVRFDRDIHGQRSYAREGGHVRARVLRTADATGAHVMNVLHAALRQQTNVTIREHCRCIHVSDLADHVLLTCTNDEDGAHEVVTGRHGVLAMGGSGQLYPHTSNPPTARGDALQFARELGLPLRDLEWMQFHPTAFATRVFEGTSPLITEALRGAGALLRNEAGERFMLRYDMRAELATRDVVVAAMRREMECDATDRVWLDCRHLDRHELDANFPTFMETCRAVGIDPSADLVPVRPVAHYQCGGIEATPDGATILERISAIGECACTGMHGSNRLASNSLLEAGVMAMRCAKRLAVRLTYQATIA